MLTQAACRADLSVRYHRTSRLVQRLTLTHADGSYAQFLESLARVHLLVLDDWLRDPLTRIQAQDLLDILDDRYGRSSTLIATQVPVIDWHTAVSRTRPWAMRFWTDWSTTRIGWNCGGNLGDG